MKEIRPDRFKQVDPDCNCDQCVYLIKQNERLWDAFNSMKDRYKKMKKKKSLTKVNKRLYKIF